MSITRKDLLAVGASALVAPSLAGATASAAVPAFDAARFAAVLAKPARHRQCFASAKLANGIVLEKMVASMYAYEIDLSEGAGAMHAVAVLYNGVSIVLAMNDALWNDVVAPTYPHFPAQYAADFASAPVVGKGNPFLHRTSAALADDATVEALVSRGAHFFVCNNALEGYASFAARELGRTESSVYAQLLAGLVPGSLVVPAGVMAINACQEARFTYLQASI